MWNDKPGHMGYFLVEVAVAFSILAIILSVMLPAWSTLKEKVAEDRQQALALIVAQNEMELFFQHSLDEASVKESQLFSNEAVLFDTNYIIWMNNEAFHVEWQLVHSLIDSDGQVVDLDQEDINEVLNGIRIEEGSLRVWWYTARGIEKELHFQVLRDVQDTP